MLKRLGERLCFAVGRPQALVCVSEGVAEEVREHYPALAERVMTIHNGVDTDAFRPGARAETSASAAETSWGSARADCSRGSSAASGSARDSSR